MTTSASTYTAPLPRSHTAKLIWAAPALAVIATVIIVTFILARATAHTHTGTATNPGHAAVVDRGSNSQVTQLDCRPTRVVHPC